MIMVMSEREGNSERGEGDDGGEGVERGGVRGSGDRMCTGYYLLCYLL